MYEELVKRLHQRIALTTAGSPLQDDLLKAADAIEDLEFACTRYEKDYKALCEYLPKWIPVTERLPSKGTNVLVLEFGRVEQAYTTTYTADKSLCWVIINGGSYHCISDADCPIKWWMPLPKPPKGET